MCLIYKVTLSYRKRVVTFLLKKINCRNRT